MVKKKKSFTIEKEDFIKFLVDATPEEINKLILEKGKPPKLIEPMIFFNKSEWEAHAFII